MNQTFNIKRFSNYGRNQISLRKKSAILTLLGSFVALFISLMYLMLSVNPNTMINGNWAGYFVVTFIIGFVLYAGNAFPFFRTKEKAINAIMIPTSIFEKYLYEFLERIVLFVVVFPIMFYLNASIATPLASYIKEYDYLAINFDMLDSFINWFTTSVITIVGFIVAIVFSGSIIFEKYPLVKSMIFIGLSIFSVIAYMLFLEKLNIANGMNHTLYTLFGKSKEVLNWWVSLFMISSTIVTYIYGYFKFKEKEVV